MSSFRQAFKEWAVICKALAEGRQALILRKGGIAEPGGSFRVEQPRFWLYPTYVHQQKEGITAGARPLLEQALAERPPEGTLQLSHFAEVAKVWHLTDLAAVERLAPLHCWSAEAVRARFEYRRPGLFVLAARVWRAAEVHELPETPVYAGCKSWVELDRELSTMEAAAVLSEEEFAGRLRTMEALLTSHRSW
jgi:hypothetical protein